MKTQGLKCNEPYFRTSLVVEVVNIWFVLQGGDGMKEKVVPSMGWGVIGNMMRELNLERRMGGSLMGK